MNFRHAGTDRPDGQGPLVAHSQVGHRLTNVGFRGASDAKLAKSRSSWDLAN